MMEFNLNSPPPTVELIEAERKRLIAQIGKSQNRTRFFMFGIWGVAISLALFGAFLGNGLLIYVAAWAVLAAIASYLTVYPTLSLTFIEIQTRPLETLSKCRSLKVLEICQQDEICESYRLAVALQDRSLVNAEANMIEKIEGRQKKEEAYRLLQSKGPIGSSKALQLS